MTTAISATLAPATYVPSAQVSQVELLFQQGVSPAEIAAMLGLSTAVVDGYLGISAPATAAPATALVPTEVVTPASAGPFPSISTHA